LDINTSINDTRRAFGILFLAVSAAIGFGSVLTEIAFIRRLPNFSYLIIWVSSFAVTFAVLFGKFRRSIYVVRNRMKNSIKWPANVKAVNGLCWAGPFIAIPIFIHFYQFLILLGIGLGNISTYLLMRKYNKLDNREQMIVGLISLFAIPFAIWIDSIMFSTRQDIAVMTSRILISVAYGTGGIYAITSKS
jgi:hypothetical protein